MRVGFIKLHPGIDEMLDLENLKKNTRISAGTEKHSMGGGVWEQTNLGGVKV